MTTNGVSSGVSSSEYNKFYAIPFGLELTAISLASVNFKNEMIETASSIAKEIFGAWTQHALAVLGTTAGTFSILQTFSKRCCIRNSCCMLCRRYKCEQKRKCSYVMLE